MAKGKGAAAGRDNGGKSKRRDLAEIGRRTQKQQLESRDIEAIRAMIAEVEALEVEDRVTLTALRNLRIADTQLRDLQDRIKDGRIDDAAFAELPDHLKRQILTRLENNVTRMRIALEKAGGAEEVSPSFKCVEEYERCKAKSPRSPIWCHIAMTICQIRALTSFVSALSGKEK